MLLLVSDRGIGAGQPLGPLRHPTSLFWFCRRGRLFSLAPSGSTRTFLADHTRSPRALVMGGTAKPGLHREIALAMEFRGWLLHRLDFPRRRVPLACSLGAHVGGATVATCCAKALPEAAFLNAVQELLPVLLPSRAAGTES